MGGMAIGAAKAAAAQQGANTGNFQYTAPQTSGAKYAPQYTQMPATPFLQSVMQQNSPISGLGDLYGNLFRSPQQSFGIQQLTPMQPYIGSTYRPNMAAVRQNLRNVAPSVQEQQRLAAIEEARRRAEEEANFGFVNPRPWIVDNSGGG